VIWPFYVTSKDLILDGDEKKVKLDRIILMVEDLVIANRTRGGFKTPSEAPACGGTALPR